MRKHKITFFLCVAWLVFEPLFMCVDMARSGVGVKNLNKITAIFAKLSGHEQKSPSPKENVEIPAYNVANDVKENNNSTADVETSKFNRIDTKCRKAIQAVYDRGSLLCACCQYNYVDINSLFLKSLGKRYHAKGYIRTKDDSIIECGKVIKPVADKELEELEKKVKSFKSFLDQNEIEFLYIQHPSKYCKFSDEQYPKEITGETPEEYKADVFLKFCRDENIDYIDLRDELFKTGDAWNDAFYKTDHHWKAETGFWAFQIVAQRLKENYNFSFNEEIIQSSSYNYERNYQNNSFLGSYGNKTGKYFCSSLDSLTKITPEFQTDYLTTLSLEGESKDTCVYETCPEGSFEEICLFESRLYKPATTFNLHSHNAYTFYNDGDHSRYVLNKLAPNDKKILLVRDSYSCVFSPFLYGTCKEFYEIDLRNYCQKSLVDCVAQVKPDIVIFMADYIYRPDISFEEKSKLEYNEK